LRHTVKVVAAGFGAGERGVGGGDSIGRSSVRQEIREEKRGRRQGERIWSVELRGCLPCWAWKSGVFFLLPTTLIVKDS